MKNLLWVQTKRVCVNKCSLIKTDPKSSIFCGMFAQRAMHQTVHSFFSRWYSTKIMLFAQGNAPDRHGVPPHQPLHLLESGPRQALQTRFSPKASWKMLFHKTFSAQGVRERLETFLEWTPEWKTQGLRRQQMDRRKEIRRSGTRWWMDWKFLPLVHPLGDPRQACGTWTCSRTSSTGRASSRSIRLSWRTTARTERCILL